MAKQQNFRANVGIVVCNTQGRVLAFQRKGSKGQWQLPQGGLDKGEEPREAAERELKEETGIGADEVTWLAEHPDWLVYEIPEKKRRSYRGQAQKWFLCRLNDDDRVIDVDNDDPEFDDVRWTTLEELSEEVWPNKRRVYRLITEHFSSRLKTQG